MEESKSTEGRLFTDISIRETLEREIRFTSGKTIYIEGLVGGQWVGRYWGLDEQINFTYWRYYEAFYGVCERIQAKYSDLILQ